jgi:hypothetical protein
MTLVLEYRPLRLGKKRRLNLGSSRIHSERNGRIYRDLNEASEIKLESGEILSCLLIHFSLFAGIVNGFLLPSAVQKNGQC